MSKDVEFIRLSDVPPPQPHCGEIESLGRQWATYHYTLPGEPEPQRYGNTLHDWACAKRWRELTGSLPSWFPDWQREELDRRRSEKHHNLQVPQ